MVCRPNKQLDPDIAYDAIDSLNNLIKKSYRKLEYEMAARCTAKIG